MVKYYEPEDIVLNTGTNEAIVSAWAGRTVVAFGRNGYYPARENIDWEWIPSETKIRLLGEDDTFDGSSFHAEFATVTDAVQEYTDVTGLGGNITQYPHIIKYDINSWATDEGEVTHIERRCRAEFNSKPNVQFNGAVAKAIIYLPYPEITIQEGIPVSIYDAEKLYESGTVLQYRKGLLNQRLWL